MTIDDFVIGTNVIHKINGNGAVVAIDFNQGMIKVLFDNGETGYYYTVATYLDLLSDLTIIEQLKTTEEKTMQEFEPITKDNIEKVLKYNGWKYQGAYIHYQIETEIDALNFNILLNDDMFSYVLSCNYGNINTNDFNEFLAFVQKRITLNPIPKKPEFNFGSYLIHKLHAFNKSDITTDFSSTYFNFTIRTDYAKYAKTKENADILIAAAKLLEGLK